MQLLVLPLEFGDQLLLFLPLQVQLHSGLLPDFQHCLLVPSLPLGQESSLRTFCLSASCSCSVLLCWDTSSSSLKPQNSVQSCPCNPPAPP
ncbi:hypothetical protein Nmel_011968, partial [Mimus melanotis]